MKRLINLGSAFASKQFIPTEEASSWHCLFPTQELSSQLAAAKIAQRMGYQNEQAIAAALFFIDSKNYLWPLLGLC